MSVVALVIAPSIALDPAEGLIEKVEEIKVELGAEAEQATEANAAFTSIEE
jgi:hypothetical protein